MLKHEIVNEALKIFPVGKIDTNNSTQFQTEAEEIIEENPGLPVVIDADDLAYISSSGLRVILALLKRRLKVSVINADPVVYDILETTGFTEMMTVKKAYKKISVEGCEIIGRGSNGIVYRTDPETIVKVYKNPDSLPDIQNERRLARYAFVHDIPTAISYDIVRVGNTYGSVFELLNADSLSKLIVDDPEHLPKYVAYCVEILRIIHSQESLPDELPSVKRKYLGYADFLKEYLPEKQYNKLCDMIEAVPENLHLVHGDFYANNVMLQDGNALLIDMDTLSCGDPVFEFASTFNAYKGFYYVYGSKDESGRIVGDVSGEVWNETLRQYYSDCSSAELELHEKRASILGYTRILRRHIKRIGMDSENDLGNYNRCRDKLMELIDEVDSLV